MNILRLIADRFLLRVSKGNSFSCSGRIKQSRARIKGSGNLFSIGKNARMRNCEICINGKNNRVIIEDECDINNSKIYVDNTDGVIIIGQGTTIAGATIISFEQPEIIIGKDCMISYDVEIRNTDSRKMVCINSGTWLNQGKPIYIDDHVWVAARCTILKGARIGHDSIIGANSLVTGNIPSHVVVGGHPAKILKESISWNRDSVIPD